MHLQDYRGMIYRFDVSPQFGVDRRHILQYLGLGVRNHGPLLGVDVGRCTVVVLQDFFYDRTAAFLDFDIQ